MKKVFITLSLVFFMSSGWTSEYIAQALVLKGNISVLPPHNLKAHQLKKGEKLKRDSSLLVSGNGFAKIKFINNSIVTLGPRSKMVIEMDKSEETSLISLTAGKMRALVEKNQKNSKQKKFLVKTQAAIMGVRGTEFQVTYEPKSQRSSLLTFHGQVDIAKPSVKKMINLDTKETNSKVDNINELLKEDFKPVVKGDFTNISNQEKKLKTPVKINATQYVLLEKDQSLGASKPEINKEEKEKINKKIKEIQKEFNQVALKRENKAQAKELGFIDIDTGFYIPPTDPKAQKILGSIEENGQYIPPIGVTIDAKKGFIINDEASSETVQLVKNVQNKIQDQIIDEPIDSRYNRYLKTE